MIEMYLRTFITKTLLFIFIKPPCLFKLAIDTSITSFKTNSINYYLLIIELIVLK